MADIRRTYSRYAADIWWIYGRWSADMRRTDGGHTLSFSFHCIRHVVSLGGRGFPNDDAWWRGGRGVWAGDDVIIFCLPYVRRMSAVCPPHICRPSAVYSPYIRRISAIPNRPFCQYRICYHVCSLFICWHKVIVQVPFWIFISNIETSSFKSPHKFNPG